MKYSSKNEMSFNLITKLNLRTKSKITPGSKKTQLFCPFHDEKEPSMFIDMSKGIFHCFSCRRKGTINALCKELTGKTIYKFLDLKYDEFQEYSKKYEEKFVDLDKIPKVHIKESDNGIGRSEGVTITREVNSFMRKRGLNQQDLKDFKMFTVPNIIRFNGTMFKDRICIPIYEGSRLLSVEGRALSINTKPKVMYPKGSSVSTLYDLEHLDKSKPLWFTEGLMDLAFLRQDPYFANSTCIFGASITERQKHLLKKFVAVYYIKENDAAGDGCVKELSKITGMQKGYLKIPKHINNVPIKDIGDFVRVGWTIKKFREARNWIEVGLVNLY